MYKYEKQQDTTKIYKNQSIKCDEGAKYVWHLPYSTLPGNLKHRFPIDFRPRIPRANIGGGNSVHYETNYGCDTEFFKKNHRTYIFDVKL